MPATHKRASFGNIRELKSGRYQARYAGPDGQPHKAPFTFDTWTDADTYLSGVRTDIVRGNWKPDDETPAITEAPLVPAYAASWIATRLNRKAEPIAPRTKSHYRWLLKTYIEPTFRKVEVSSMTAAAVRTWYSEMDPSAKTARAHAYSLMQSVMETAVQEDRLLDANPCRIKGAGKATRDKEIRPASLDELEVIVKAMPDRMQLIILISAWCALRFGEVTELRRKDIDLKNGVIRIKRGVVRVDGEIVVGAPKSEAGKRPVHYPPHLTPAIKQHLHDHTQIGANGLLFWGVKTGKQLPHSSLLYRFNQAKHLADRDDMTPHTLRHTGAVLAARNGATLKELMARLGHSTADMAIRYQHASEERDLLIAQRLSEMVTGIGR